MPGRFAGRGRTASGVGGAGNLPSEKRRVLSCTAIGVAIGGVLALLGPWQLDVLAAFDVGAATLVGWIWLSVMHLDGPATAVVATREDDSRGAARSVTVAACVASLAGVLLGIVKARQTGGAAGALLIVVSLLAVVTSWMTVHTIFALRYAHRYYDIGGGLVFPDENHPCYRDFAYVAFTVGMTFQVSDTEISDRGMRSLVLRQAALAYLFGTVIVGLTINVLGGLLG